MNDFFNLGIDADKAPCGVRRKIGFNLTSDFYPTPRWATERLLEVEPFNGDILEPACGNGALSKILQEKGFDVISNDLIDRGFGNPGIDFLTYEGNHDNIITNPPFSLSYDFILQSKKIAKYKIAFLLRTVFLEGVARYEMFQDPEFPFKGIHVFSKRLTMTPNGEEIKSSGMISFSWFIWEKGYKGKPTINWIL